MESSVEARFKKYLNSKNRFLYDVPDLKIKQPKNNFAKDTLIREFKENQIDDLMEFVEKEEKNLKRIPMIGFIDHKANFNADGSYSVEGYKLGFTREALSALCFKLGVPYKLIETISQGSTISNLLNDLIFNATEANNKEDNPFYNCEFVVDESRTDDGCNGVVYGIVTDKYLGYSNNQLLKDAEYAIKGSGSSEQLILKEAVSINSKIRLRFLSNKFSGIIRGYDDSCKEDVTRIGLELSNSMCGESSVIFKYFLYRLLCSNGLTLKSEDEVRRIIHIGKQSRFRREIEDNIVAMASGFSKTMDFISNLSELEFNPTKLARLFGGDKCLSIIPDSKQILRSLYPIDQNEFEISKKELTSEIKKQMKECETEFYISKLPEVFACDISRRVFDFRYRKNASMFDFINVFTEYANHLSSPAHKIGIQERTGDFANWLKENKKSFITN